MAGRSGQRSTSDAGSSSAATTWVSVGPYWLSMAKGCRRHQSRTGAVMRSCSPAVAIICTEAGVRSGWSARWSASAWSITTGRNSRAMSWREMKAASAAGSRRVASSATISVPPSAQARAASCIETSKPSGAKPRVRAGMGWRARCQPINWSSVRQATRTPLGVPVEPEVKSR
jgi:hypothetical protein